MTTLQRSADTAFTYTLTVQDSGGNLVTPTVAPTATMFTDTGRTLGAVALTVAATAQPQVFTVTGPATAAGARYLKHVITTSLGVRNDLDDDLLFLSVVGGVQIQVVTVDEVREQLNIPLTDTSKDDELQDYIDRYLPVIEEWIGGPVLQRTFTQSVRDSGSCVVLDHRPVLSVSSVTVDGQAVAVYSDASPYGYDLRTDSGLLYLDGHRGRASVTYTAGFAQVPANIKGALLLLIQINYSREQQGYMPGYGDPNDVASGGPTLAHVKTLLAPHLRGPNVA